MSVPRVESKNAFFENEKVANFFSVKFYQIQWKNVSSLCEKVSLEISNFIGKIFDFLKTFTGRIHSTFVDFFTPRSVSTRFPHYNPPISKEREIDLERSDSSKILSGNLREAARNARLNEKCISDVLLERKKMKPSVRKQVQFADFVGALPMDESS